MGYNDRYELLQSAEFKAQCKIALTDWLNYWATNGTSSITDPELREKTDLYIKFATQNLDRYGETLATLVIGEDNVKTAQTVTDDVVTTAVTHVLATALDYLL